MKIKTRVWVLVLMISGIAACTNPWMKELLEVFEEGGTETASSTGFAISFNANNGSGTIPALRGVPGVSVTLPSSGFTRTGKTLAEWNTLADGTGTSYALGASYTVGSSDVTLYAVWDWANTGTTGDPRLIADIAALKEIDADPGGNYKLENDLEIEGTWESLCFDGSFQGIFDGDGHTITFDDVTIIGPDPGQTGWGLFGTLFTGTIKNLKVAGSINAARNDGGTLFYVGGIVGFISPGGSSAAVKNCVSTVDITAVGGYAGGIVGGTYGPAANTVISCCYATGTVNASSGGQGFYGSGVGAGGIVGLQQASITASYTTGAVSASASGPLTNSAVVGGITGDFWSGTVINSAALNPGLSVSGGGTLTTWRIGADSANTYGKIDMTRNGSPYTWTAASTNGTDVAMGATQSESWWQALFGPYWGGVSAGESAPWKWNVVLQRPVLWFE